MTLNSYRNPKEEQDNWRVPKKQAPKIFTPPPEKPLPVNTQPPITNQARTFKPQGNYKTPGLYKPTAARPPQFLGMDRDKFMAVTGKMAQAIAPNSVGGRLGKTFGNMGLASIAARNKVPERYNNKDFTLGKKMIGGKLMNGAFHTDSGTFIPHSEASPAQRKEYETGGNGKTALIQNYTAAKKGGYKGTLADWKTINKANKVPATKPFPGGDMKQYNPTTGKWDTIEKDTPKKDSTKSQTSEIGRAHV